MMKRIKKRLWAFLLAVVFAVALVPVMPALAATSGTCGANLTWTLDDEGTLTISGTGDMTEWSWSNNAPWYSNREYIKTAVIENGVTSIGSEAFDGCSGLTSVTIPGSVTSIGWMAFDGCSGLTSVTIPDSVTSIGDGAFCGCSGLTSVTIPNSVTSICNYAFYNCNSLTSITIPDSVTSISDLAFAYCSGLISIDVDENNEYYCSVDGNLFNKDKTLLIQYAVGKIDISYTIPDSVTSVGGYAFSDCSGLTSVTIPGSVASVGESAFDGCDALTDVYYAGTQEQWNAISIDYDNSSLTSAAIHYSDEAPKTEIQAIGEYSQKVNVTVQTTGGSVRVELEAAGADANITEEDIDVFALSENGASERVVKLAPSTDGDTIVYTGSVSGDSYKIFVWDKSLVPVTEKYEQ